MFSDAGIIRIGAIKNWFCDKDEQKQGYDYGSNSRTRLILEKPLRLILKKDKDQTFLMLNDCNFANLFFTFFL